ncbi:hypothetical protein TNIN_58951 [Trichonephila inaurata madagascariensis]|uniref:Uncharacterized protein n=1 Tax=Trichonephila inaurata madagascariensis TaxID=2747483 RepID=A0A8X6XBN4_9ARAC|nr:hypothetical protein TNIN_58951 [Trichonephila inaurata madagascariensis]
MARAGPVIVLMGECSSGMDDDYIAEFTVSTSLSGVHLLLATVTEFRRFEFKTIYKGQLQICLRLDLLDVLEFGMINFLLMG